MSDQSFEWSDWRDLRHEPVLVTLLTALISTYLLSPFAGRTPVTILLGLPFLLFLPGYLVIVALFPTRVRGFSQADAEARSAMSVVETVTLSVVGSLAVTMLAGFALNYTPWGITRTSIVAAIGGVAVFNGAIGAYRRANSSAHKHLRTAESDPSIGQDGGGERALARRDAVVYSIAGAALLFGAGTSIHTLVNPRRGERYTEFSLLTENETGDLVAGDYPERFTVGESKSVVVAIANDESETTTYEVVVELHRVRNRRENATPVDRERIVDFSATIDDNETVRQRLEITPTMTGRNQRLTFFLYRDQVPDEPSLESAYRSLHLWVTVDNESDST